MSDEDVSRDEPAAVERVPDTDDFRIMFNRDGECRIALLHPVTSEPIATLTLGAEATDELARVLTARREAHAQAEREERDGPKH